MADFGLADTSATEKAKRPIGDTMNGTRDIIAQLKAARKQKGLTYQAIADRTAELGKPVSLSTVKRVFSSDSEQYDFRYESTIQPIAEAIMGVDAAPGLDTEPEKVKRLYAEIEGLKAVLEVRENTIGTLTAEVEKAHAAIRHKSRVEWVLALIAGCLSVVLVVFYVAHALMGW
jgi:transcriptional regulator with XRE-family HTH domain